MLDPLKPYLLAALVLMFIGLGSCTFYLNQRVDFLKATVSTLEETNRGLNKALKAVEKVNTDRTQTTKQLEGVKQQINEATEAPLPSPIGAALDGLRRHQQAHRTGQPSGMPGKPAGSL